MISLFVPARVLRLRFVASLLIAVALCAFAANSARAQSCAAVPDGIVSWWAAEGDAVDQIGGNNGTLGGNTTFGPGEVGRAFVFDGQQSYINLGAPTSLELQDFTIEAWIQRSSSTQASLNGSYGVILAWGQNGYGFALWNDGRLFLTKSFVDNQDFLVGLTDTTQ